MPTQLVKGNTAVIVGALYAGCDSFFGYPITPASEILHEAAKLFPPASRRMVQAESEEAAINMVYGAASIGERAMTSSSSPGISLKQEGLSYMVGAELPGVIVNMNRGGPGLGDIGSSQGDYFQSVKGGGHGDYFTYTLAPSSCQEAYDMMFEAFDVAFAFRNPVLVLGDAIVAQMKEPVRPRAATSAPVTPPSEGLDWCLNGAKDREHRILRSLFLDEGALAGQNRKLAAKYEAMRAHARAEVFEAEDAELVVVAYGSIGRIAKSAVRKLRAEGKPVGLVRPITLFPFPEQTLVNLAATGKRFLTIEHNCGQMVQDVRLAIRKYADSEFFGHMPGEMPGTDDFIAPIMNVLEKK